MYNVQQVIDRYKGKIDRHNNVIGYLSFGGLEYYKINSSKPLSINSDGSTEFLMNEEGQVEHYQILSNVKPKIIGYYRLDHDWEKIPVSKEEIATHSEWEKYEDYHPVYNDESRCKKWYGETIDKYYFHPYYPLRKISSFEVIRIIPGHLVGSRITIGKEEFKKEGDVMHTSERVSYYLYYPEFFKPIYDTKR